MRLCIDPGHGGPDPGATGGSIVEASYCWMMGQKLAASIGVELPGWEVIFTREETPTAKVRLEERGDKSRGCDLVISLHCNASASALTAGAMVFFWPDSVAGNRVAFSIHDSLPFPLKRRTGPYPATAEHWPRVRNVLRFHAPPAVLVEMGFLTNATDAKHLNTVAVQDKLIESIVKGVRSLVRPPAA